MTSTKNSPMKAKIIISLAGVLFAVALLFGSAVPAQAALTTTQVDAIIGLLQSFGADQSIVYNVRVSLAEGTPTLSSSAGGDEGSTGINLKYNLYLGIKDSETSGSVTQLQKFLAQDTSVYPEGLITGFFGPMTERAVKKWQAKHGVVSSGSPNTTGYGVVGPKTRERLNGFFGETSPSTVVVTPVSPVVTSTQPTTPQPVVAPIQPTVPQPVVSIPAVSNPNLPNCTIDTAKIGDCIIN